MPRQHHWKRLRNPRKDRVRCIHCGVFARAIHWFRTGRDTWTFEPLPASAV